MSNVLQLVVVNESSKVPTTDSRRLAEGFGANHKDILRKIDGILVKSDKEFTGRNFTLSDYIDESGKSNRLYEMTRDGFMHIALTFSNTERGNAFRVKVIRAFNEMEKQLSNSTHKLPRMNALEILQGTIQELVKTNAQLQLVVAKQEEQAQQLQVVTEHASEDRLTASQIASIEDRLSTLAGTITSSPEARIAFRRVALRKVKSDHLTSKYISGCTYKDIHASKLGDIMQTIDGAYELFTKRKAPEHRPF